MSRLELSGWVQIEVTSRCNLRCRVCPRAAMDPRHAGQDLPRSLFERLVDATLRPGQHYHLQGWGEPLLRSDLPELAATIAGRGGLPSVTTNGSLITRDLASQLVAANLHCITLSLQTGSRRARATQRPGGRPDPILEAFRQLREAKRRARRERPLLAASWVMTRDSIGSLAAAIPRLKRAGVQRLIAIHPLLALTAEQASNRIIPLGDSASALRALRRAVVATMCRSLPFTYEPLLPAARPVCREDPLGSLFVAASGEVSPCAFLGLETGRLRGLQPAAGTGSHRRTSMGHLGRSSLAEIWRSPAYRAFRRAFEKRRTDGLRWPAPEACQGCLRAIGY